MLILRNNDISFFYLYQNKVVIKFGEIHYSFDLKVNIYPERIFFI
jgi:hypothetical protein